MPNMRESVTRTASIGGLLLTAAVMWSCQDSPATGTKQPAGPDQTNVSPDPVLVGAGDIARCYNDGDEITAALLDEIAGTVMAVGDNAYEIDASPERVESAYTDCYVSSWGRHRARTRPTPGNHEYLAPGAPQYYAYYGDLAGPAGRGYYSFDLGTWRVITLNSNVPADANSEQMEWLRADLAANPAACTVAYWHHPVFSSGINGNNRHMAEIWRVLDSAGVDLVVVAHDHNYERFAPQDYTGRADSQGIRQIVVGTGGGDLRPFGPVIRANSEVRSSGTYGVLKLTLRAGRYEWAFVPQPGATFTDAGSANCV
jgi:acid phosphatase type 7